MIVQSAAPDGRHLVLTMEEHTATGAALARHFGGGTRFCRPEPRELFIDLVAEHDRGWVEIDEGAPRNPDTDLPFSVYQAPIAHSLAAGARTIDHNERQHPYRGLLSSMHICGLYNGRFGLTEPPELDLLAAGEQAQLAGFLDREDRRRRRLRSRLAAEPHTSRWVGHDALMTNYKALQFFDRLALWLQVTHPATRRPVVFDHVPGTAFDHAVRVEQVDDTRVRLDPYPFDTDPLSMPVEGRLLEPQPPSRSLSAALAEAHHEIQDVVLVGG